MPIRFNHRELVAIASKNKEEYDKQGVLSLREVEDKIFHKADSEWCFNHTFGVINRTRKLFLRDTGKNYNLNPPKSILNNK